MQVLHAQGNTESALEVYDAYQVQQLQEDDVTPSADLKQFSIHLRKESLVPNRKTFLSNVDELMSGFPLHIPLVGRGRELTILLSLYQRITSNSTQVILIEGEAGIGKTRLVEAFLKWTQTQSAEALYGRSYEMGGRLPYGPLLEAFRGRLEQENAPDDILADVWLAELSRLFPELRDRYPDLPMPPLEGSEGAGRLFEAVAQLGIALSQQRPMVLVIDDLQWADYATQDLLAYAGRRWNERGARVLLVLVRRTESLPTTLTQDTYFIELTRSLSLTKLILDPLDVEAVQQLIRLLGPSNLWELALKTQGASLIEQQMETQMGNWLFAETGGQPFFLVQALRELWEQGVLKTLPSNKDSFILDSNATVRALADVHSFLPTEVRHLLQIRLARLTSDAFEVLVAASILLQNATFEALIQVSDVTERALSASTG